MKIDKCKKASFVVIGKEGSTSDGEGFIQKLWDDANSHFGEVQHLAKKDENGNISGIWGAMSDFSRSFQPWEDFNKGLYLAGVECNDAAEAPEGWTKTKHCIEKLMELLDQSAQTNIDNIIGYNNFQKVVQHTNPKY